MDIQNILSHVDHTLLKVDATWDQIKTLCDEAMEFGCATVCIPPSFVKAAVDYTQGYLKICTVIGFPNGYNTLAAKLFETKDAVENGASEIDMVINNGLVKERQHGLCRWVDNLLGINHRVAIGRHHLGTVSTRLNQSRSQPLGTLHHIRLMLRLCAD